MVRVQIPYNPELILEHLFELVAPSVPAIYPGTIIDMPIFGPTIVFKKSMMSACVIRIKHEPKKNLTYIEVATASDGSINALILTFVIIFGGGILIGILILSLIMGNIHQYVLPIVEDVANKHLRG